MHKTAPLAILGLVAIVGIVTLLLSVAFPTSFAPMVAVIGTKITNTIGIKGLELGEPIGEDVPVLTGYHLEGLSDGVVVTDAGRTDYKQYLRLRQPGVGGFNGGSIRFVESEAGKVGDFLVFDDAVFELEIEFSPGLGSSIKDGKLPDMQDEYITLLGQTFAILDAKTMGNAVELKLWGGFGSVEFVDDDYRDDSYTPYGAKVNGQAIDAPVKIKAVRIGDELKIYSIQYRLNANAVRGGDVFVLPKHCVREFLQYPEGMLSTEFDICYGGVSGEPKVAPSKGLPSNVVKVQPRGDHGYWLFFTNNQGRAIELPLADIAGGLHYGDEDDNLVFVEAPNPGAPNICPGDYFIVWNKADDTAITGAYRYDGSDGNTARFEDLAGGSRSAVIDPATGQGTLIGAGTNYAFVRGAGGCLAMDQTGDGNINGGEARVVIAGGGIIDLGPGFTLTLRTRGKRFDEAGPDEVTSWNIFAAGGEIDLQVPSPQNTGRGTMKMISEGGGVRRGMTFYGVELVERSHRRPASLEIYYPGGPSYAPKGGATGMVVVTLERSKLMKPKTATTTS